MSININIAHRLYSKHDSPKVEVWIYDRGHGVMFYARDDDHANLIVDTIQRGVTNELYIEDEREIY